MTTASLKEAMERLEFIRHGMDDANGYAIATVLTALKVRTEALEKSYDVGCDCDGCILAGPALSDTVELPS